MTANVRSPVLLPRLVPIMQWVFSRALLCFAVYENAVHPVGDGPIPASNWTFFMLGALLLALPLSLGLPIGAIIGWRYMRRIGRADWRWLAAWGSATGVAVLVEAWLIRSVVREVDPLGIGLPKRGDLGPLELLAAFVVAAAVMMTVLMIASGVSRRERAVLAR